MLAETESKNCFLLEGKNQIYFLKYIFIIRGKEYWAC